MKKGEAILYVSEVQMFVRRGQVIKRQPKKIVITVDKCYVFWHPYHDNTPPPEIIKPKSMLNEFGQALFAAQQGFQQNTKPKKSKAEEKEFYSITGEPQYQISLVGKHCKLIDENHPVLNLYLTRNKIQQCDLKNAVILVEPQERVMYVLCQKVEFFFFKSQDIALRFVKAIECVGVWETYVEMCYNDQRSPNERWALLLQKLIYEPLSMVVIDPEDFENGEEEDTEKQIKYVCKMLDSLSIINSIQFKFAIKQQYGYNCMQLFIIGMENFRNIRKLTLQGCSMDNNSIVELTKTPGQLSGLVELNLSHNFLTDVSFQGLILINRMGSYLKYFNLSYNKFSLQLTELFKDLLMSSHQYLILDFSHNQMDDGKSIDTIEGTVLYADYPPVQKLDISHNYFSDRGARRLFMGYDLKKHLHPYVTFILYPLLFVKEIFNEKFPSWEPTLESINKNKLLSEKPEEDKRQEQEMTRKNTSKIRITKINISKKRIPTSLKQIQKINLFIRILKQSIEKDDLDVIYETTKEIKSSTFEFPLTAFKKTYEYLTRKMNEMLFFRNHKNITKVSEAAAFIGLSLQKYKERLNVLGDRKFIFVNRLHKFLNFQLNQMDLVTEIQEIVKQSLRLSLGGPAIKLLFKLKLEKDRIVKQLINSNYNPEDELRERRIQNYIKLYQYGAASKEEIPLELKQQQEINSNLFEVYVQANYFVLANITKQEYTKIETLLKTDKSTPKKFVNFILLARRRMFFITNQYYSYASVPPFFSISYEELKINVCRLLWNYNNYETTEIYNDLPNFPRKISITVEKNIRVVSRNKFMKTYSIHNCSLIQTDAKVGGIYEWGRPFTAHANEEVQEEIDLAYDSVNVMLDELINLKKVDIGEDLSVCLLDMILLVRQGRYPEYMLEEIYINIICYKGADSNDIIMGNLCQIISFLTFYLRPPLTIEKELIAYLAEQSFDFDDTPLSLSFNRINEKSFVDRDWLPTSKLLPELLKNNGKINIPLTNPDMTTFMIELPESSTVEHLFKSLLIHESIARFTDKTLFWIYKYNRKTNEQEIIMLEDYLGEIMSNFNPETDSLIIRRRIYEPYYLVCYSKFKTTDTILNSIYHEIKYFYLRGFAYRVELDMVFDMAKMIAQIDIFDRKSESYQTDIKIYAESVRYKMKDLVPITHLNNSANKVEIKNIGNRLAKYLMDNVGNTKKEFKEPMLIKQQFLSVFRDYQFFCATNYGVTIKQEDQQNEPSSLLSINSQFMYIEEREQTIFYQNILLMAPRQNEVVLEWYDKTNEMANSIVLGTASHRYSVNIVMDILSYCTLRLLISNKFLYYQRELHQNLIVKNRLSLSLFDGEETNAQIVDVLMSDRDDEARPSIQAFVKEIKDNLQELEGMQLITFKEKDIIHCQKTKYCKEQLPRDIFPNRKRLATEEDPTDKNTGNINPPFNNNNQEGQIEIKGEGEYVSHDMMNESFGEEVREEKRSRSKQRERLHTEGYVKPDELTMLATKRSEGPMTSDRKGGGEEEGGGLITFRTFRQDEGGDRGEQEGMTEREGEGEREYGYERKVSELERPGERLMKSGNKSVVVGKEKEGKGQGNMHGSLNRHRVVTQQVSGNDMQRLE